MAQTRVVIPTFNRGTLVEEAIESALQQTVTDLEVVVVDDGSEDNTPECLERIAKRSSRVRCIRQDNAGVAAARNAGISAPGNYQYVAFLDSDDIWEINHLEKCIEALSAVPEAAVSFGPMKFIDLDGNFTKVGAKSTHDNRMAFLRAQPGLTITPDIHVLDGHLIRHEILMDQFAPLPSSVVVRSALVARKPWFDVTLEIMEDLDFFIFLTSFAFVLIDAPQGTYRRFGDNLTASRDLRSPTTLRRRLSVRRFLKKKIKYCQDASDRASVRRQLANCAHLIGQCYAEQDQVNDARKSYLESLRYRCTWMGTRSLAGTLLPRALKDILRQPNSPGSTETPIANPRKRKF